MDPIKRQPSVCGLSQLLGAKKKPVVPGRMNSILAA
jgi:hypothetical protein